MSFFEFQIISRSSRRFEISDRDRPQISAENILWSTLFVSAQPWTYLKFWTVEKWHLTSNHREASCLHPNGTGWGIKSNVPFFGGKNGKKIPAGAKKQTFNFKNVPELGEVEGPVIVDLSAFALHSVRAMSPPWSMENGLISTLNYLKISIKKIIYYCTFMTRS